MKLKLTYAALVLASTLWAAPAHASVRVYGEATSAGPSITVRLYADITGSPVVSHSVKLYYDPARLELMAAARNEEVWFFHDGSQTLPQPPPLTIPAGEVLFVSGHMDARNPGVGVNGLQVLLGTVLFARRGDNIPSFDLAIGRGGQFANFVTVDGVVLEGQVGEVDMQSVMPSRTDEDLDGLGDKWEHEFFGGTRGVSYADDPDRDGVSNLDEALIGSNPTDPHSNLHLRVAEQRGRIMLEWPSVEGRTYMIEGCKVLGKFEALKADLKATPPHNSHILDRSDLPETMFFRVQVQMAAPR